MSAIGRHFDGARRGLAAISAGLLLGLLVLHETSNMRGTSASAVAVSHNTQLQAALTQWQALWSRLDSEGSRALEPDISDPSLRAAGDTAFMRYRNLWDQVPANEQRQFQLAALANSPERKARLLEPLSDSHEPLIRFRASLELARMALRQDDPVSAAQFAQAALRVPELPAPARADAAFLLGFVAAQAGQLEQAETYLRRAIQDDPGFWDARQLQLRVLGELLAQPNNTDARCLERARELIEHLGALPALAQDRGQFRDIADHFARQSKVSSPALDLMTGMGYLWAGDAIQARARLSQAAQGRGHEQVLCQKRIAEQARAWVARLP